MTKARSLKKNLQPLRDHLRKDTPMPSLGVDEPVSFGPLDDAISRVIELAERTPHLEPALLEAFDLGREDVKRRTFNRLKAGQGTVDGGDKGSKATREMLGTDVLDRRVKDAHASIRPDHPDWSTLRVARDIATILNRPEPTIRTSLARQELT